ncbi:MAG: hypothetical protein ACRDKY_11150 [Solirubrobacteraceae bacterium]
MIDAAAVGALLAPALPYLLRPAAHVASQAADALGDKSWEYAKRLWAKLGPHLAARPAAQEAAEEVAAAPADEGAQYVLAYQLRKLLERDAGLAAEVEELMAEASQHVEIRVAGDRNVTIAAPVDRSTIISGDANTVDGA